jgi:protein KRI1
LITDCSSELALQELDLEGEWDPEMHDKQMAQIYDEGDGHVDDEKPRWDDDIDIGDIVAPQAETAKKAKKKKKKKKGKGEDGVDDVDVNAEADDEQWDGTDEMRKKKLDEYMDEVYDLDFNDIVRPSSLFHNVY